jgi:hypothetical protein
MARALRAAEPALAATEAFGPNVAPGLGPGPKLVLEDHGAITLFERVGDVSYSYRALLLAGEGDLAVIGVPRSVGFEDYCREVLRLGRVEILRPRAAQIGDQLAVRAAKDADLIERAAARGRAAGGLNVLPYMGTGGVWMLAGRIAERAGTAVRVAAPPPQLTRRSNDKLWFAARAAEVLGPRALPPASAAYNLTALAGQVAALARRHHSVAVKLPASASSAGNLVLESAELRGLSLRAVRERLRAVLSGLGWPGAFPLMVTAWERPILASPSVQLWIPGPEQGTPVVEGIFDQTVLGETAVFSGAAPSRLAPAWCGRLAGEAARLATLLQELGYFGRCSFDSILVGDDEAHADLHWVECNGRWGGVSIPMTLANRLLGDWTRRPPVIIERCGLRGPRRRLADFLAVLEGDLYRPGLRETGVIVLSPGRIEAGSGYQLMVLGETLAAARASADALVARLAPPAEPS